jgi:hypothetical protein
MLGVQPMRKIGGGNFWIRANHRARLKFFFEAH